MEDYFQNKLSAMKYAITIFFMLLLFTFCIASCSKKSEKNTIVNNASDSNKTSNKMKIVIGETVFTATLESNPTVTAFKLMLPLKITMSELNGNEKNFYFAGTLPTNTLPGGNIQPGDLMLYNNNCLVLFYKSFSTSYSYTKLGRIDNVTGLVSALGSGEINIRFELE